MPLNPASSIADRSSVRISRDAALLSEAELIVSPTARWEQQ
jgi:hypothetical protein